MISNRDRLATSPAHAVALSSLEAGITAARPEQVIARSVLNEDDALIVDDTRFELSDYDQVVLIGGGKAAGRVARALEAALGERLDGGVVVAAEPVETDRVELTVGDHPKPTERSVAGGERVLEAARDADEHTLVLATVSGGGSALLAAPVSGITLADLRAVTGDLLESGADIDEINAVRKHTSAIKGGRLARAAAPAPVLALLFSDVVGDDPATIASGPLAPDPTTFGEALSVLDRYEIDAPATIREHLEAGAAGDSPETPGPGDSAFTSVSSAVIANARTALDAAADAASERNYPAYVLSSRIRGEAREAALTAVAIAEEMAAFGEPFAPPAVVLSGGETTVTVRGDGTGGPNHEFALAAALELDWDGVVVAAVDTDGRDGAADAAGAIVDAGTVDDHVAARAALTANDAGRYLRECGATIETGPTGTNVNDLRAVVVDTD